MKYILNIYKSSRDLSIFLRHQLRRFPPQKNAGRPGVHIPMPSHAPFPEGHIDCSTGSKQRNMQMSLDTAKCWTTPNLRILNFAAPIKFRNHSLIQILQIWINSVKIIVKTLASSCTTFSRWRSFSFILGNRSLDSIDRFNASHWQIHLLF